MRSLFACCLFIVLGYSASGQVYTECTGGLGVMPPFGCQPIYILGTQSNAVVPGCLDSLVLCMGLPMPPVAEGTGNPPARLIRDRRPSLPWYDTLEITTRIDTRKGTLIIYPSEEMPITEDDGMQPALYIVEVVCDFWNGQDKAATHTIINKQHVIRAYAEARTLNDSFNVDDRVFVSPPPSALHHLVSNGVSIQADQQNGQLIFSHWTCNIPGIDVEPSKPSQVVTASCWPLLDTVVFTAWYRDPTSSVAESITIDGIRDISQHEVVLVYDLLGRPVSDPFHAPRGVYLVHVQPSGIPFLLTIH